MSQILTPFRIWRVMSLLHLSTNGGDQTSNNTTAKISNKFSLESPYISHTFSRESPKCENRFQLSQRSPRHSKYLPENRVDLEIQIFWVWTPPWADHVVVLVSRIDKIVGLFCKRALQERRYSAKETYNSIDPANRSHPINEGDTFPLCLY